MSLRRNLMTMMAVLLLFGFSERVIAAPNPLSPPSLYAETAILMDADTGQVVFGKDIDKRMYPASITKIMTCMLALEKIKPDKIVTMTNEGVDTVPRATTHIALSSGETMTAKDLEYAMMVESANDAANGLAIHMAGSIPAFADMMNERAASVGAVNTHFTNANGLPEDNHYTTARDMALITRAAMKNPEFVQISGTERYEISPTNKQSLSRHINNRNYMFALNDTYPGAFAGKTGWTEEAGHTLMTLAQRDDVTLICIVMHSDGVVDAQYKDSTALFDYGFGAFSRAEVPMDRVIPQQIPFTTTDGTVVDATLLRKQNMPVLLPAGVVPENLEIRFALPNTLDAQTAANAAVELIFPNPPQMAEALAGRFPLTVQLPEILPATVPIVQKSKFRILPLLIWIAAIFVILIIALFIVRKLVRSAHERKRRRKRAQEFAAALEAARRNPPVPPIARRAHSSGRDYTSLSGRPRSSVRDRREQYEDLPHENRIEKRNRHKE